MNAETEVPYLENSPQWSAVIAKDPKNPGERNNFATALRLLQLDVAVKDSRLRLFRGWIKTSRDQGHHLYYQFGVHG